MTTDVALTAVWAEYGQRPRWDVEGGPFLEKLRPLDRAPVSVLGPAVQRATSTAHVLEDAPVELRPAHLAVSAHQPSRGVVILGVGDARSQVARARVSREVGARRRDGGILLHPTIISAMTS